MSTGSLYTTERLLASLGKVCIGRVVTRSHSELLGVTESHVLYWESCIVLDLLVGVTGSHVLYWEVCIILDLLSGVILSHLESGLVLEAKLDSKPLVWSGKNWFT